MPGENLRVKSWLVVQHSQLCYHSVNSAFFGCSVFRLVSKANAWVVGSLDVPSGAERNLNLLLLLWDVKMC